MIFLPVDLSAVARKPQLLVCFALFASAVLSASRPGSSEASQTFLSEWTDLNLSSHRCILLSLSLTDGRKSVLLLLTLMCANIVYNLISHIPVRANFTISPRFQIKELRLKGDNSLIDESDCVSDILRDGDTVIAVSDSPAAAAPAAPASPALPAAPTSPPAAGTFDFIVKTLTGKTIHVQLPHGHTDVVDAKKFISDKEGIPTYQMRLIFAGRQLGETGDLITDYGVGAGAALHLILRLGGPPDAPSAGGAGAGRGFGRFGAEDAEDDEPSPGLPAAPPAAPSVFNIPEGLPFALSDESITLDYRTPSMLPTDASKQITISLGTTMERFRELLVLAAQLDVANVVADLHLSAHPILVAKETAALTLAQWGFSELKSFHSHLAAGSVDEDGQQPEFDATVYVSFRRYTVEVEKYASSQRDSGESRFYLKAAWQPHGKEQTLSGMSNFLSTLYVVASYLGTNSHEVVRFLGHFSRRIRFPPATLALEYLIKQKSIHQEQKAALASALWHFARRLVPEDVTAAPDRLFEHSTVVFGFLLSYAETPDIGRAKDILEHSLLCSLTQTRLQDPVHVSGSGSTKIYNIKALHDRMEGGPMFVANSPWSSLKPEVIVVDKLSKFLLMCHPFTEEILLYRSVRAKKLAAESESLAFPWTNICSTIASDSVSSCCNIVPSLSLRTARVPSLAFDAEMRACVYLGPEPCSVDTVTFLSPSECKSKSVNPAMIAKTLGTAGRAGAKVDSRPPKEAIIVCFDTSSSMGGYSFSNDKTEESEAQASSAIVLKVPELHAELQKLREDKHLHIYRRLARKRPVSHWQAAVMRQLAEGSPLRKALVDQMPESVIEVLKTGDFAVDDDEDDDDEEPSSVPDRFVRPADPSVSFQVFVKTDGGKTVTVDVDVKHTVLDFKIMINERTKTPGRRMRLVFGGKQLNDDSKTLGFYSVEANSNFFQHAHLNFGRRAAKSYQVQDIFGDHHEVTIRTDKTVFELKLKLWELTGQRPAQFSLWTQLRDSGDGWRHGVCLDDTRRVMSYDIDELEMDKPYKRDDTRLTRIQTVKQLFHAYINRSQAYNYANHIGLMLFGTNVDYTCKITPLFEVFRDEIEESSAQGETALYDALDGAADALVAFQREWPDCKLRIIVLSDGDDTSSKRKPWEVAKKIQTSRIVCDSVLIGEGSKNKMLRSISKASGGYCFAPSSLRDALKLNELETFLSLFERPDVKSRAPATSEYSLLKYADLFLYPFDVCNDETIPLRRMPAAIKAKVQALEQSLAEIEKLETEAEAVAKRAADAAALAAASGAAPSAPVIAPASTVSNAVQQNRMRKIMKEITNLMRNPHPAFDIYPNSDDLSFWKVVMAGPDGCPYSEGTWLLYISFPENYPQSAPEVRFLTPIRHANVNSYGKICHSIFTRNWTADTSVASLLACVYGLLLNPDCDDPIDTFLALQFFEGNGQYEALIMAHVSKHAAAKTRQGWRKDLLSESSST